MLIEFDFISPEVAYNLEQNGYRVYLLPRIGEKVYAIESDGAAMTVCRVLDGEKSRIILGHTPNTIYAGTKLVLNMDDGKRVKAYPRMDAICAVRRAHWTSRTQARARMKSYNKARNQATTT